MRATLALIVVLAAVVVAGCGGSSNETRSLGDQTVTVSSDTHGVYAELETILDQLPYQRWYTRCVVGQVEKVLSPAEAEALAELPESEREQKAMQVTSQAGPTCEAQHHRPVIDPNASTKELDLLRAGYVTSMKAVAESHGASSAQTACIEKGFQHLPPKQLIGIGNGSAKLREGILLSVFKPCAKVK
ncbi:MAG TPA: hypothetical protein VGI17_09455 [Solirubrobacterales bacterium]